MCGKTIHMLPRLLTVLKKRFSYNVISLPPLKKNDTYKAFMFARKGCGYSQKANRILQERLKINTKEICIVDSNDRQYLCAEKWQFIDPDENLQSILDIWDEKYKNATFPQVFIHAHPKWYYVGGCEDLEKMTTTASTVVNTQVSDQLHLLPLAKEGIRTPPTQLKF